MLQTKFVGKSLFEISTSRPAWQRLLPVAVGMHLPAALHQAVIRVISV